MKIGVFVGSFNPVHKGHIKIANHLINNKYVDKVIFIAGNSYWNKINIDLDKRIKMLEFYESNTIIVEREVNNLKYTYQVMSALHKRYKNDELYLIIGADNIVNFNKWKNYKQILKSNLIIINRNNIDIKYYLDKLDKKEKYLIIDCVDDMNISSTIIRNNIKKIYELIDYDVLKYIIENNLYQ